MPLGPGSRLDGYELIQPLGAGGMGEVWLAKELRLERKVALKLLPAELTRDPARVSRFEQEARAASALNHPNVCHIYALGQTEDSQHYIAMEYVEGETLRKRLSTSRIAIRESLDTTIQIAAALSAAHRAGIVHRDIKPENVMVRPDGLVKVLDFGLAKLALTPADTGGVDDAATVFKTEVGMVVGTAAYMSPEQARGLEVDARTDIWSLGVLLSEMVAGHRPFAGTTNVELSSAILRDPPAPLPAHVPATVGHVVAKCLAKDPGQRYQHASEVRAALEAASAHPVPKEQVSRVLPHARRRVLAWTAITAAIISAGLFVLNSRDRQRSGPFGNPTSLAILPLINATGSATAEYLSDGISDVGLIRFRGHLPKGGYDVQSDGGDTQAAPAPPVHRRVQSQRRALST